MAKKNDAKGKDNKSGKKTVIDEKLKEKADNKVKKDSWIRATMMIEVLATKEDSAKSALEKHIESMGKEKWVSVYKKDFSEINRIENPIPQRPDITEGFSQVADIELVVQRYEDLVNIVMHYGPSSVEILEPVKFNLEVGEAQGILNSMADLIHKFVAAGLGGLVVKS